MTTVSDKSISSMVWTNIWPDIWYCIPIPELMYVITTKAIGKEKNQYFIASVGEVILEEHTDLINSERMWSELEFKMNSDIIPQTITQILCSAFQNCAADFAFKTTRHIIND